MTGIYSGSCLTMNIMSVTSFYNSKYRIFWEGKIADMVRAVCLVTGVLTFKFHHLGGRGRERRGKRREEGGEKREERRIEIGITPKPNLNRKFPALLPKSFLLSHWKKQAEKQIKHLAFSYLR